MNLFIGEATGTALDGPQAVVVHNAKHDAKPDDHGKHPIGHK